MPDPGQDEAREAAKDRLLPFDDSLSPSDAFDAGYFAALARAEAAEARLSALTEAGREALVALAALKLGDVPDRHAPELWQQVLDAHDLLFAALSVKESER